MVIGDLLLANRDKLRNRVRYLTMDSSTVFTSVVVDELFLSAMGELANRLPDDGFLYSLDSCGFFSATAIFQRTVQEQLT